MSFVWPSSCIGKLPKNTYAYSVAAKMYIIELYIHFSQAPNMYANRNSRKSKRGARTWKYIMRQCVFVYTTICTHGHVFEAQQFVLAVTPVVARPHFNMHYHFWVRSWIRQKYNQKQNRQQLQINFGSLQKELNT